MPSRRQFIASIGAGVVGLVAWRYSVSTGEDAIVAIVRKRLNYLKLDLDGVHAFAKDLIKQQIIAPSKIRLIDMAGPIYTQISSRLKDGDLAKELNHGEERIVSMYLLSSDFFQNGEDQNKLVHYVGFYDPFNNIRACNTPFVRPVNYSKG